MTVRMSGEARTLTVSLEPPPAHCSEYDFQTLVVDLARWAGWFVVHNAESRFTQAGVPDLLLIRERVLWFECKTATGRVRPEQTAMHQRLREAGQTVSVIRPEDWPWIVKCLTAVADAGHAKE